MKIFASVDVATILTAPLDSLTGVCKNFIEAYVMHMRKLDSLPYKHIGEAEIKQSLPEYYIAKPLDSYISLQSVEYLFAAKQTYNLDEHQVLAEIIKNLRKYMSHEMQENAHFTIFLNKVDVKLTNLRANYKSSNISTLQAQLISYADQKELPTIRAVLKKLYQTAVDQNYADAYEQLLDINSMSGHMHNKATRPYVLGLQIVHYIVMLQYVADLVADPNVRDLGKLALDSLKMSVEELLAIPEVQRPAVDSAASYMIFSKSCSNLQDLVEKPVLRHVQSM